MGLIEALQCENRERPPVWLMRQAGRYLPAYQTLKKGRRLVDMFHEVATICEVTHLPFRYMPLDAAILFSDILTVLDGLGIGWDFHEVGGPVIATPVRTPGDLKKIAPEEAYPHIREAIVELKRTLSVPLLGFAGAPFTIASYLIEGKTSKDFHMTKRWMYADIASFQELLDKITDATIDYLNWQIDAGVDAVQIFDSWAFALSPESFRLATLPYLKRIVEQVTRVPVIVFCRGTFCFAKDLVSIAPSAISFDWSGDLGKMRSIVPSHIALQGNLDPALLYGKRELIAKAAGTLLDVMRGDPGYIFNLGHGILPDTPLTHVQFLVDYVRNHR